MSPQYIASFDEKDTSAAVKTLLGDKLEQVLKGLCLKHSGPGVPAAVACLDGLPCGFEIVGNGALILYMLGMKACFGKSRYC
ncbi:hypothetical protein L3X38_023891 [Prunus dulcis]|uniref:Uncharacterized protein n=1 Tax=Prunus dulcis TaxID=3755 RepID=A0AAD4Z5Y7_PRUDU|nr:hypothetical protein L3X38_023891 [Prunus dulcis]